MTRKHASLVSALALSGGLFIAAPQAQAQICASPVPQCYYEVFKGGGDCAGACRGFCMPAPAIQQASPIDTSGPSCMTSPSLPHLFSFHQGIARPGFLLVSSSVDHHPEPSPAAMGGAARFFFDDLIISGPAGATSVQVTFSMMLDVSFNVGDVSLQSSEAHVRLDNTQTGFDGRAVAGHVLSVTATVSLDGGSPVSRSSRRQLTAYVWHRVIAGNGQFVQGQSTLRSALGCQVFSFSAPGFTADSVSAGIVDNRLPLGPDCCPANFNNSGGLTVQDIFDFLAAYFANDPAADFNGSGALSVQDIFDFLAAYFAGCN